MSKHRRFHRQSATNPAQIKASGVAGPLRVPVVLDDGNGVPVIAMVTREDYEKLQKRRGVQTIQAEAGEGSQMSLTVGGGAGNMYAVEDLKI